MKRFKFTEDQIAYALRQVEGGTLPADISRQLGVSEACGDQKSRESTRRHVQSSPFENAPGRHHRDRLKTADWRSSGRCQVVRAIRRHSAEQTTDPSLADTLPCDGKKCWRRRPDLNRGWRFWRFRRVVLFLTAGLAFWCLVVAGSPLCLGVSVLELFSTPFSSADVGQAHGGETHRTPRRVTLSAKSSPCHVPDDRDGGYPEACERSMSSSNSTRTPACSSDMSRGGLARTARGIAR